MINFIKKSIYLHKEEFVYFPLVTVGIFVLGHLILWLVMLFDNSEDLTSFELGTVLALMSLLFIAMFSSIGYVNNFNYALSMSQKRGNIITGLAAVSAIKATITIIIIALLNILEQYVCKTAFKEFPMESNLSVVFKPHIMLIIMLAFVALETLFGALYTKLGMRYFWIVWIAITLLMQLPARIIDKIQENDSHLLYKIIDFFTNCNKIALFSVLTLIMLAIISLPFAILKKQRVTI